MTLNVVARAGGSVTTESRAATNALGKLQEEFMTILLTQLRYQDPMEPLEEKDFFAQLAQFATASETRALRETVSGVVEKMSAIQRGTRLLEAAKLIGLLVAMGEGEAFVGEVQEVGVNGEDVWVVANGRRIPLEEVTVVGSPGSQQE